MNAHDMMPGVPPMGHVTTSGFWHPGAKAICHKCRAVDQLRKRVRNNSRGKIRVPEAHRG